MTHLEDEDIARLIDGKLGKEEQEQFLKHLSQCDDCLTIYTETLKFVEQEKRRAAWWRRLPLPDFKKIAASLRLPKLVPEKRYRWAFAALVILLLVLPFLLTKIPAKHEISWWLKNHGNYAKTWGKNDPRVGRTSAIFARLKRAADKGGGRMPRLAIINTRKEAYALALPDGGIIINPTTLDTCFSGVARTEGEARLAFILGHELAHLAHKDPENRETILTLQEYGEDKERNVNTERYKQDEIDADINGALYAAMAGYNIGKLFTNDNDFLRHWAKQTGIDYSKDRSLHPAMQKRVLSIREHLSAVAEKVELFRAGVLLFQSGNYHDAAAAFKEFSKVYPAREVFNNIGACCLHLALHHLHLKFSKDYYRFRLSTAIDYATGAEELIPRGDGDYLKDEKIVEYLADAERCFKMAVARDAYDRACRYNLAAALILRKEYARARAVCTGILKQYPRDTAALNNKAVALYYQGKTGKRDTTTQAMRILQRANNLEPANYEVLYNLAALNESTNRQAAAKLYRQKYLKLDTTPRDDFYIHVYKKLQGTVPPKSPQPAWVPEMPADISLADDFTTIEKRWGKAYARTYKLGSDEDDNKYDRYIDLQVIIKGDIRVIALDGIVEVIERELAEDQSSADMLKKLGPAQKIVRHTSGHFYVYKSIDFSFKEINGKVRSHIWFEKGL